MSWQDLAQYALNLIYQVVLIWMSYRYGYNKGKNGKV